MRISVAAGTLRSERESRAAFSQMLVCEFCFRSSLTRAPLLYFRVYRTSPLVSKTAVVTFLSFQFHYKHMFRIYFTFSSLQTYTLHGISTSASSLRTMHRFRVDAVSSS